MNLRQLNMEMCTRSKDYYNTNSPGYSNDTWVILPWEWLLRELYLSARVAREWRSTLSMFDHLEDTE